MAEQGTTHYRITLDSSQLDKGAQQVRKQFDAIGKEAVKQSRVIDNAFAGLDSGLSKNVLGNIDKRSSDAFGKMSKKARELATELQEDILSLAQLEKLQNALNDSYERGNIPLDKYLTAQARLSALHEENVRGISDTEIALKREMAAAEIAEGSIAGLQSQISLLTTAYMRLSQAEREGGAGAALLKDLTAVQQKLAGATASMNQYARTAGAKFNGLNYQVQQLARELPVLAMGPEMFFLAISNNLPWFTDELSKARKELKALQNTGQKGIPVWKQLSRSILSWQTALVVGITLLVAYGDEIVDWIGELFTGKKALDEAAEAARRFHAVMTEGAAAAQKEVTELDLLYDAATDTARSYDERRRAVDKLQELYPAYFGNMDAESIMLGTLRGKYEELKGALIEAAQARAAFDQITKNKEIEIRIKTTDEFKEIEGRLRAIERASDKISKIKEGDIVAAAGHNSSYYEQIIEANENGIRRLGEKIAESLELPEEAKDDILAYLRMLDKANEKLGDLVQKQFTAPTPDEKNKEAEEKRAQRERTAGQLTRSMGEEYDGLIGEQEEYDAWVRSMNDSIDQDLEAKTRQAQQLLREFETYRQGLARIEQEYGEKRTAMYQADGTTLRPGFTQENVANLDAQEQGAKDELALMFAEKEEAFQIWMNQIADYSLEQLQTALAHARLMLQAEQDFGTDSNSLAVAQAKVLQAEKMVASRRVQSKGKEEDSGNESSEGAKRSINDWEELYDVLSDVDDVFGEIGDTVGGTAGEILSAAGSIASSTLKMVDGIITLATGSIKTVEGASTAASAAIKGVEKASMILAIVGAAMQVVQKLVSLFNGKSKETKEYEQLKAQYEGLIEVWDQLLDKKRAYLEESWGKETVRAKEEALELLDKQEEVARELAMKRLGAGQSWGSDTYAGRMWSGSYKYKGQNWQDVAPEIEKELGVDIQGMHSFVNLSAEQLQWIKENYAGLWSQMDGEVRKYFEDIIEYGDTEKEIIEEAKTALTGITFDEMRDHFADALGDMNMSAEDFVKDFNNIIRKKLINDLFAKGGLLGEDLQEIYDTYAEFMEDGFIDPAERAILDNMVKAAAEKGQQAVEDIDEALGTPDDRTASAKGTARASQESMDEKNGRLTAIQGHTALLVEQGKEMAQNMAAVLRHLAGIETNTGELVRLEKIETRLTRLDQNIEAIATGQRSVKVA